ncbi:MAG: hypothetical protein AB7V48_01345 [Sedimentibacter sp.]
MKNRNQGDNISVDIVTLDNVKPVSSVGDAPKNMFCIYKNKKHAVGSVVQDTDGSEMVCTEDGSWKNSK